MSFYLALPGIGLLDRYLFREIFRTAAAITVALLLLIFVKLLMQQLGYLMEGKFSSGILFGLLGQKMVTYFVYVLPLLALLSVVVALGRLSRDSEMTALFAGRYATARILWPLTLFGLPLLAVLSVLALEISPSMAREAQLISHQERVAAGLDLTRHGQFLQPQNGDWGLHAQSVVDGEAQRVFFASYNPEERELHVELATQARQVLDTERHTNVLHFQGGRRYSGWPGDVVLHRLEFDRHQLRIPATPPNVADNTKYWSWEELWHTDAPAARAERQWRVSLPVSLLLMLLLAVPLSRGGTRSGKYAGAAVAVLIYLLYVQSQLLVISQVRNGSLDSTGEVLWVHAALALLIAWSYRSRWRQT